MNTNHSAEGSNPLPTSGRRIEDRGAGEQPAKPKPITDLDGECPFSLQCAEDLFPHENTSSGPNHDQETRSATIEYLSCSSSEIGRDTRSPTIRALSDSPPLSPHLVKNHEDAVPQPTRSNGLLHPKKIDYILRCADRAHNLTDQAELRTLLIVAENLHIRLRDFWQNRLDELERENDIDEALKNIGERKETGRDESTLRSERMCFVSEEINKLDQTVAAIEEHNAEVTRRRT